MRAAFLGALAGLGVFVGLFLIGAGVGWLELKIGRDGVILIGLTLLFMAMGAVFATDP